jgi:glucuronate isomerase
MKAFMDSNFMLQNKTAEKLYHDYAAKMPIIDYHSHLPVNEIAEDKKVENLSQIWLNGDHYKWRAMRTNGVDERYCTGDASDWEKFQKWAETVPHTMRNPLYHWTHMELKTPFGIKKVLNADSAKDIYDETSKQLQEKWSVKNIIEELHVKVICSTDDPVDSLAHHIAVKKQGFSSRVLPTWRPDKAMAVENTQAYNTYVNKLSEAASMEINSYDDLLEALKKRHDFFHAQGCRISDHGLETIYAEDYTENELKQIFEQVRSGKSVSCKEVLQFKSAMLYEFAIMDHAKGWAQQFHCGAMRNNNDRMFNKLGPDTGFDSIGDYPVGTVMSKFFNKLDRSDQLAKTIIYNLNPADNALYATMLGNYQDGTIPGKIQWGSGWWFLDQKYGMIDQINTLSMLGLLSRFVGMLTDSRSFLSFPRHDYFRRILCNIIGSDVENGELPGDMAFLGKMVEDISYNNAKNYFQFPE